MVRLVKGAYWDTEIKRAQVLGLDGFPVFTRKQTTDLSYLACARKLLDYSDRIYPQFATHNAHTIAAVLEMAGNDRDVFEFQRLHGMGEDLHDMVHQDKGTACRIYAPVGAHRDLLAYLVRRLLENGANSSFVNQILDHSVPATEVAADPIAMLETLGDDTANPVIAAPVAIFGASRRNAMGWDLTDTNTLDDLDKKRAAFLAGQWTAGPTFAQRQETGGGEPVVNPAVPSDIVGHVQTANADDVTKAIDHAIAGFADWSGRGAEDRADCLRRIADLYETHAEEFFALAAREAGKTLLDAVAEVREAVDFLRYYADEAERMAPERAPRGPIACISPWNFPLAIFTGQISAALAAGNAVIAKPAEQTPLIAARAVALMHEAGVPREAIQLLPGDGPTVGGPLLSDPRIKGCCFTGSTETARIINRQMAEHLDPDAVLIAETGGLNAMIVDSSALPEQAVRDIVASAFQSAGQRCSALRVLYVQEDVADTVVAMLRGAMDALSVGNPWQISTDVGPVIDAEAQNMLNEYIDTMERSGHLEHRIAVPDEGRYVAPTLLKVSGIGALEREMFGPVLHVARFSADKIDQVVEAVNASGYGLTFGIHTRIDDRVQRIVDRVAAGNVYVNRNQIGAVVGSQPFGGEGLSGTGPKAGGPYYVSRFTRSAGLRETDTDLEPVLSEIGIEDLQKALEGVAPRKGAGETWQQTTDLHDRLGIDPLPGLREVLDHGRNPMILPGPTGESNRLSLVPKGRILCLGSRPGELLQTAVAALVLGNAVVVASSVESSDLQRASELLRETGHPISFLTGQVDPATLRFLQPIDAVAAAMDDADLSALRHVLALRSGPIMQPVTAGDDPARLVHERHVCVDTTAAGGNATLMSAA